MTSQIAHRSFGFQDQEAFARLTGDRNPMHIDAVAARRTQAAAPVVHGLHAVLWALDRLSAAGKLSRRPSSLKVTFQRFIFVGSLANLSLGRESATDVRAEIFAEDSKAVTLDIGFGQEAPAAPGRDLNRLAAITVPLDLSLDDCRERAGAVAPIDPATLEILFPAAAQSMGAVRLAALAQLSYLVGMVCPGLHSLFSGFNVHFAHSNLAADVAFEVTSCDDRFRLVEFRVWGGGIEGSVTAFARHAPVQQPNLNALQGLIEPAEFAGVNALIVGGSRGLGALSARLLALGGAHVAVTYAVGQAEAQALVGEIGSDRCHTFRYDALEEPAPQIQLPWPANHVYYFATPPIFRQKAPGYVASRFAEFCAVYIDGFARLCGALRAAGSTTLTAFYPSSVAVENHPRELTEYSMAKAAGEMLCADLNKYTAGLKILVKRLPRVLTDQTATVMPVESADATAVMLPILREMQR